MRILRSVLGARGMVALAALLVATPAMAGKNMILGKVVDRNGAPVDRAIVSLVPGNVQLVTDRDGAFTIDYLRDDEGERIKLGKRTDYKLEVFKPGYHVQNYSFYYAKGTITLDRFTMVEETIDIEDSNENLDPELYDGATTSIGATYEGQ